MKQTNWSVGEPIGTGDRRMIPIEAPCPHCSNEHAERIALVHVGGVARPVAEQEAFARLIAAAPEVVEALRTLANICDNVATVEHDQAWKAEEREAAWTLIRRAVRE